MKTMLAGAALAAMSFAQASAQDGYEDHYRAYQAATEAEAKLSSGEAAWRAAETELGAVETTAILAQNHLFDRLFVDPDGSAEVAARALTLGEQSLGLANMALTELQTANAYVKAAQKPRDDGRRDALLAALLTDRDTGRPLNRMAMALYRVGTMLAYEDKDYTGAYDYVAALTDEVRGVPDASDDLLAGALLDEAAVLMTVRKPLPRSSLGSRLRGRRTRYTEQLADAEILLAEALSLGGPHGPIETFDPVHARAHAWLAVSDALRLSVGGRHDPDHECQGRRMADFPDEGEGGGEGRAATCGVEWIERGMRYPNMGRRQYNGAVFVGYHIGQDGGVEGARILSEVPGGKFGPAILDAMQDWRAKTDGQPSECLRDQVVSFKFIVK